MIQMSLFLFCGNEKFGNTDEDLVGFVPLKKSTGIDVKQQ